MDKELLEAAQIRAAEAAVYFVPTHKRPNGSECFTVSSKANGENLAAGQKTATSVMDTWMKSSGHKANILDEDFQSIGIGCFKGTDGNYYWSQVFSCSPADEEVSSQSGTVEKTIMSNFGYAFDISFWIGVLKGEDLYVGYGD